ncbi:hypothetical protein [Wolbachia endosymbiont of Folsomia candida]|uniref:hypothetical protein n=1 Tax=Wolbachia endosymbiont of Folsomia candida TaxID=169402 RepID=UPI000B327027|nr:hypothetical protein [Wolbachia endosymbiont of Folsomia candida]APR98786.1 hypothetical protein ASM33_06155 [Wolbachia endosymbiont of Folsomia candida]
MNKEISKKDKQDFSEHTKNGEFNKALMIVYRLTDGIKITQTVEYKEARESFLEGLTKGDLELCVAMIQQYPDVFNRENKLEFIDNHYQGESKREVDDDFEFVEKPKVEKPKVEISKEGLDLLSEELDELDISRPDNGPKR